MAEQYRGPERRIHFVYLTASTEYHVRAGICVAVRPREPSTPLLRDHFVVNMRMAGSLEPFRRRASPDIAPTPGCSALFVCPNGAVITAPIVDVRRPPKEIVAEYPPPRGASLQA